MEPRATPDTTPSAAASATPSATSRTTHRWVVDGIEEDVARIVEDEGRTIHVPASLLPTGVREGHVLDVAREDDGQHGVRLTIAIDAAATEAAQSRARASVARSAASSKKRDRGGDVAL